MRRITYWLLSTISAVVLLFSYHTSTSGAQAEQPSSAFVSTTSPGRTSAQGASGGGSPSTTRTVTGSVAQTQWGPVQVQLTVQGGTITRASVLQYPTGNQTDEQINAYALPILVDETTAAQGAGIDMVSGATITSNGYLQSLQSALDQAGL
jgi:uncharacterized protein with FMN-binding domain